MASMLHAHQALALQVLEEPVEYAGLGPTAHARANGVPGAVVREQRSPLAAVGRDEEDAVDHVEVVQAHVAALTGQQWAICTNCARVSCIGRCCRTLHWSKYSVNATQGWHYKM